MILLRLLNLIFLLGLVACLAGAIAGLIVFAPFVGGAWLLTLVATAGSTLARDYEKEVDGSSPLERSTKASHVALMA